MIIVALVMVLLIVGFVVFAVSAREGRLKMLKVLYALAIALLVVAFVGFGISAFYPAPEYPEGSVQLEAVGPNPTDEERELIAEQRQKEEAYQKQFSDYNVVVASISIGIAVVLLVGSILWLSSLDVIGDGVTLGAVFTLFYGLIRAFMTENEVFRFIAVAVGLGVVITLVFAALERMTGCGQTKAQPPRFSRLADAVRESTLEARGYREQSKLGRSDDRDRSHESVWRPYRARSARRFRTA